MRCSLSPCRRRSLLVAPALAAAAGRPGLPGRWSLSAESGCAVGREADLRWRQPGPAGPRTARHVSASEISRTRAATNRQRRVRRHRPQHRRLPAARAGEFKRKNITIMINEKRKVFPFGEKIYAPYRTSSNDGHDLLDANGILLARWGWRCCGGGPQPSAAVGVRRC